jgi:uncharacterized protein YaaQ
MKLIIAIVRDSDLEPVSRALTSNSFRVTLIASTGGFLRRGSTTLLIGVENDQVEQGLELIRANCAPPTDANPHRGTIFVIPVEQYVRV